MDNETAIAYAKVAIMNISLGQKKKEMKTEYILKYIENEMVQLMDLYTEKKIIEMAKDL